MAKKPTPKAAPTAKIIREEVVGLKPPRLDAAGAHALAKAQAAAGFDAPPIVAASLASDQAAPASAPPAQDPPAADAGVGQ